MNFQIIIKRSFIFWYQTSFLLNQGIFLHYLTWRLNSWILDELYQYVLPTEPYPVINVCSTSVFHVQFNDFPPPWCFYPPGYLNRKQSRWCREDCQCKKQIKDSNEHSLKIAASSRHCTKGWRIHWSKDFCANKITKKKKRGSKRIIG